MLAAIAPSTAACAGVLGLSAVPVRGSGAGAVAAAPGAAAATCAAATCAATCAANCAAGAATEEKKAAVLETFEKMRAEGREVRCVGAIKLLTAKQVQVQLALRHFLDKLSVRRSGKDGELRPLLEQWVGTSSRAPTGGRVLEGVIKLPLSPPQARKFWRYGL